MERLLDAGKVMVHLLPGLLGVRVPSNFRHERILRLNFSYRFGIADFQVDERGVRARRPRAGVRLVHLGAGADRAADVGTHGVSRDTP